MKKTFIAIALASVALSVLFAPVASAGITNFPNGVASWGMPLLGSGPLMTSGNVFFVDSSNTLASDSAGRGTEWDKPFATIDYAIGRCTANNGDIIFVGEGHTETISAASGLDIDVAGVRIVGLGNGVARATIVYSTSTSADIDVAAANCSLEGFYIDMTGIDALTSGIDVAAAGFTMRNCYVLMADSGGQALEALDADSNADRLVIENCAFVSWTTSVDSNIAVDINGADDVLVKDCSFQGVYTTAPLDVSSATTNYRLEGTFDDFVAESVDMALPATTTANAFTIVGGPVEIIDFMGTVTTVIEAQACTLTIATDPAEATLSHTELAGAGLDVNGDAVGTVYSLKTSFATNLQEGAAGVDEGMGYTFFAPPGNIELGTTDTNTGAITWRIRYRPLAPGAYVIGTKGG